RCPAGPLPIATRSKSYVVSTGAEYRRGRTVRSNYGIVTEVIDSSPMRTRQGSRSGRAPRSGAARPPSPPLFHLHVEKRRIVASGAADGIADLEADGLDGGRDARGDRPVGSELRVRPGPPPRRPGRARDWDVRLDVDSVRRRLAPLHGGGDQQRQVLDRPDG